MPKNINLKSFIYALVFLSIGLYIISLLITVNNYEEPTYLIKTLPSIAFIVTIISTAFVKWFWKFKIFKGWLVPFPDLNGTYKGEIKSTWVNPETGQRPAPIPCIISIKQSFLSISCTMRTKEMTSYSFSEKFLIDEERQVKQLYYSYDSNPKSRFRHRSQKHLGTMKLSIFEAPIKLEGEYWTERKTTGDVILEFMSSEVLNEFPKDLGVHPVSKEVD